MYRHSWVVGIIVAGAVGVLVGVGQPTTAATAALSQPAAATAVVNPNAITWQQARAGYPSLVRKPTWLPPGIVTAQLNHNPGPGSGILTATYTGPKGAWTLIVQEAPGSSEVSPPPAQIPATIAGVPVMLSKWTTNGTHLVNINIILDGNTYDVNGINVSLAVAEHVAAGLISS